MIKKRDLSLPLLAWGCAILPCLTIHTCYLIAASYGHVEWCLPYWDACSSISATGRQMPEKILFKAGMIPSALLTAWLWWNLRLRLINTVKDISIVSTNSMLILGLLATFFLILYTLALGIEGQTYQSIRRVGVTLSIAFTFMAQLLGTSLFGKLGQALINAEVIYWYKGLLSLLCCLLLTGIVSVFLDIWMGERYDSLEDAFEWNMALMLQFWFAGTAILMSKSSISL